VDQSDGIESPEDTIRIISARRATSHERKRYEEGEADPVDGTFRTGRGHGAIPLILGGGGTSAPLDVYGVDAANGLPQAKVFTKPNRPIPGTTAGTFVRLPADAREDAIWSARRDSGTGYGIAVFDLDPGERGRKTSITIRYFHAPGADKVPTPDYELFETVVLSKPRRGEDDDR
jgi:hypothetical protein